MKFEKRSERFTSRGAWPASGMVGGLTGDLFIQLTSTLAHLSNITNHHLLGKYQLWACWQNKQTNNIAIVSMRDNFVHDWYIYSKSVFFFRPDQTSVQWEPHGWILPLHEQLQSHWWIIYKWVLVFNGPNSSFSVTFLSQKLILLIDLDIRGLLSLPRWQPLNLNHRIVNWQDW